MAKSWWSNDCVQEQDSMKINARIEKMVQVGPYDYRVYPVTKTFDSTSTIDEIDAWAKSHGSDNLINNVELTQPE